MASLILQVYHQQRSARIHRNWSHTSGSAKQDLNPMSIMVWTRCAHHRAPELFRPYNKKAHAMIAQWPLLPPNSIQWSPHSVPSKVHSNRHCLYLHRAHWGSLVCHVSPHYKSKWDGIVSLCTRWASLLQCQGYFKGGLHILYFLS
jgi:hypothetical protein